MLLNKLTLIVWLVFLPVAFFGTAIFPQAVSVSTVSVPFSVGFWLRGLQSNAINCNFKQLWHNPRLILETPTITKKPPLVAAR
jgi:hypothetical protein